MNVFFKTEIEVMNTRILIFRTHIHFLCKFVNNVVNIKPEIPQNQRPDGYPRLILENKDL